MYAKIGSISESTLNTLDLAFAYAQALRELADADDSTQRKARVEETLSRIAPALQAKDEDGLVEFVHELAPPLFDEYCPPYAYFGSHPGNGSDIGFWPDIDAAMEAARYSEDVVKVEAGDEWPDMPDDVACVLEVNDHGNVTLYDRESGKEIWSCI